MPVSDAVIGQRAEQAVSDYLEYHRDDAAAELHFYRAMPTLRHAIRRAARARTAGGGKHPHQWRIAWDVLRRFGTRLAREERALQEAQSFDELHRVVQRIGELTHGIGELAVYDTALRIGAKLELPPARVYLHRGTRGGAGALGLDHRRPSIAVSAPPGRSRHSTHTRSKTASASSRSSSPANDPPGSRVADAAAGAARGGPRPWQLAADPP